MTTLDGLPERLRADIVTAGFVTSTGEPDREAFAEALARAGKLPWKTARRYSYRWTTLNSNNRPKWLGAKNATLAARVLKTAPERYRLAAQPQLLEELVTGLADVRAALDEFGDRLRRLEDGRVP